VYCADDLSDLVPLCREMIEDDRTRERIGRNARDYFDRFLHREQLGGYYLSEFLRRCGGPSEGGGRRFEVKSHLLDVVAGGISVLSGAAGSDLVPLLV
jgi:hypothetical protein